jgi:hypothetical protein
MSILTSLSSFPVFSQDNFETVTYDIAKHMNVYLDEETPLRKILVWHAKLVKDLQKQ